jgi:predicted kinase
MRGLILMVGTSGSGKSYKGLEIRDVYEGIYLSSDRLRAIHGKDEGDQSVSAQAFATLRTMVDYFLSFDDKAPVIVDATNLNRKSRKDFIELAKKHGAPVTAVCMLTPLTVAKERNKKRDRVVPEHVIDNQFSKLVWPTLDEVDSIVEIKHEE